MSARTSPIVSELKLRNRPPATTNGFVPRCRLQSVIQRQIFHTIRSWPRCVNF
ncbi:hypothetical protein KPSA1_05649 [Pseudomonas syringae pv. actinidiae]|uniref:Uncharacterized protein n=1 Tax=Pseudomonas syringae pv. actinidiae TaxID=103796 RepID=A0A2V0QPM4_PSESF|nr:hypothetical protein KPSA1_05649 [Pseudomonas syringae pv. actinidiae]